MYDGDDEEEEDDFITGKHFSSFGTYSWFSSVWKTKITWFLHDFLKQWNISKSQLREGCSSLLCMCTLFYMCIYHCACTFYLHIISCIPYHIISCTLYRIIWYIRSHSLWEPSRHICGLVATLELSGHLWAPRSTVCSGLVRRAQSWGRFMIGDLALQALSQEVLGWHRSSCSSSR